MALKAIVVGGSGLIGRNLLNILCQRPEYDEVISIGRKKVSLQYKSLTQIKTNLDDLDQYAEEIKGHAVFCCVGTTNKKTPDQSKYRVIDHDYPIKLAQIAKQNEIGQFHLVSSIGADSASSNFYLKTKGETEKAIKAIGLNTLFIYEPSLLVGSRSEPRLIEDIMAGIMKVVNPFLFGGLRKYRSISAYVLAMAMYKRSLTDKKGIHVYTTEKIKLIA